MENIGVMMFVNNGFVATSITEEHFDKDRKVHIIDEILYIIHSLN